MVHVQRALDDVEALIDASHQTGNGLIGRDRLGVRLPPLGEPARGMLRAWRVMHSSVDLAISEMNDHKIRPSIQERRLDVALIPSQTIWPTAVSTLVCQEHGLLV